MTIASAGDAALLLAAGSDDHQGGNEAASVAAAIRAAALPGVIDIVPGAQTVLVTFAPGSWAAPELAGLFGSSLAIPRCWPRSRRQNRS